MVTRSEIYTMNDQHVTLFHIVTLTDVSLQILHMIVKVKLSFFSMIGCGRSPFKPTQQTIKPRQYFHVFIQA
jgi:hypothetical protein